MSLLSEFLKVLLQREKATATIATEGQPLVINPALTLSEAEQAKQALYRLGAIRRFLAQHDNIDPVKLEEFRHEVHGLVPQLIKLGHGSWEDLEVVMLEIGIKEDKGK